MMSKCSRWHLRGTYLKFVPGAAWPGPPERLTPAAIMAYGMAGPRQKLLFIVDRAGISETGISGKKRSITGDFAKNVVWNLTLKCQRRMYLHSYSRFTLDERKLFTT